MLRLMTHDHMERGLCHLRSPPWESLKVYLYTHVMAIADLAGLEAAFDENGSTIDLLPGSTRPLWDAWAAV